VRVPIPVVIFLAFAVVGGTWWYGSRNADFLTPPPKAKLDAVRARVESSLPPADHPDDAVSEPAAAKIAEPPPPPEPAKPVIDPGDLTRPPGLDSYCDLESKGTTHLMDLAAFLETQGQFQRALLAWERVIDTGKPDDAQTNAAITAIKRLRPTLPDWNTDPSTAIPVTLHAGTGKKPAQILTPILEETARELEHASAGILKVTAHVTAGKKNSTGSGPPPVALWFSGSGEKPKPRSTEVLSFTMGSPESLHEEVRKTAFQILRGYLGRVAGQTPPRDMVNGVSPMEALSSHITRRSWREVGTRLNLPPEKNE
jgi:hypothetical protein